MENITLNREKGLKWFYFFTKVRPVLYFFSCIMVIIEISMNPQLYLGNIFMLVYVVATLVQCVLVEFSAIKSSEDNYGDFVRFVKKVLLVEIFCSAYSTGALSYFVYNSQLIYSLLAALNNLIVLYFLWYRLNVRYFEKRMLVEEPITTRLRPKKVKEEEIEEYYDEDEDYLDDEIDSDSDYELSEESKRSCYVCGLELDEDDVFCQRCGTRVDESEL